MLLRGGRHETDVVAERPWKPTLDPWSHPFARLFLARRYISCSCGSCCCGFCPTGTGRRDAVGWREVHSVVVRSCFDRVGDYPLRDLRSRLPFGNSYVVSVDHEHVVGKHCHSHIRGGEWEYSSGESSRGKQSGVGDLVSSSDRCRGFAWGCDGTAGSAWKQIGNADLVSRNGPWVGFDLVHNFQTGSAQQGVDALVDGASSGYVRVAYVVISDRRNQVSVLSASDE